MWENLCRAACIGVVILGLAACKTADNTASDDGGASSKPADDTVGYITKLDQVKLTLGLSNTIQVRGTSSKEFTYDHLMAVLYCRAWQYAVSKGFSGGYVVRFYKLEGANKKAALVAIGSIQLRYDDYLPADKTPLEQSWCDKVPAAAL